MFYDPELRANILNFFEKECNCKLNKNHTKINFYINRDKKNIWDSIQIIFHKTRLENAPLAQKIYHLTHNISPNCIPDTAFINMKVGYRKGKKHSIKREPTSDILLYPIQSIDKTKSYLKSSIFNKNGNIVSWINDISKFDSRYISSIYKHTADLPSDVLYKYRVLFLADVIKIDDIICPYCSKSRKKSSSGSGTIKTCGSAECAHSLLSQIAIKRKSYLSGQTVEARKKSGDKNRGRNVSLETRKKISESLKSNWANPSYRERVIQKNRQSGTPGRISQGIKRAILEGKFTPQSNNYFDRRDEISSTVTGINNYRSKWEKKFHEKNPNCIYEGIRIPYIHNNETKIYIVDFVDIESRILYEIKPLAFIDTDINSLKFSAAREWCNANNFKFKLITEREINEK